jgi:hypothetical protein
MKILDVLRGPVHSSDWPDWDDTEDGFGFPYGQAWVLICKFQDEDGNIDVDEFHFEDREEAMVVVDHFVDQIVPYHWEDNA